MESLQKIIQKSSPSTPSPDVIEQKKKSAQRLSRLIMPRLPLAQIIGGVPGVKIHLDPRVVQQLDAGEICHLACAYETLKDPTSEACLMAQRLTDWLMAQDKGSEINYGDAPLDLALTKSLSDSNSELRTIHNYIEEQINRSVDGKRADPKAKTPSPKKSKADDKDKAEVPPLNEKETNKEIPKGNLPPNSVPKNAQQQRVPLKEALPAQVHSPMFEHLLRNMDKDSASKLVNDLSGNMEINASLKTPSTIKGDTKSRSLRSKTLYFPSPESSHSMLTRSQTKASVGTNKSGDFCVSTPNVLDTPINECGFPETAAPVLPINRVYTAMKKIVNLIVVGQNQAGWQAFYTLVGRVFRCDVQGIGIQANFNNIIAGSLIIPAHQVMAPLINWIRLKPIGRVAEENYDAWSANGHFEPKKFIGALANVFRSSSLALSTDLAAVAKENLEVFDNSGLYAKLLHIHNLRVLHDQLNPNGQWAVAAAWANPPEIVDLHGNANYEAHINQVRNAIMDGTFVFFQGINYNDAMLPFLWMLASSTNQYTHAADVARTAAEIVPLPAIRVMIVHFTEAAPQPPDVNVRMNANQIMMWIREFRNVRKEHKAFLDGMYLAMNVSFGSWSHYQHPAVAENLLAVPPVVAQAARHRRGIISVHHESNNTFNWPYPWDVNYTARAMGFVEPEHYGSDYQGDFDCLSTMTSTEYGFCMAGVASLLGTAVTTVMYSYQISAVQMEDVCRQSADIAPYFRPRVEFLVGEEYRYTDMPLFWYQYNWFLFNVFDTTMPFSCLGPRGWGVGTNNLEAGLGLHGGLSWNQNRNRTYQPWNILSTWNFVLNIPREWGVVGPGSIVDFSREIRINTPGIEVAWSVASGTSDIAKYSLEDEGYKYIDYAGIACNAITQAENTAAIPVFQVRTATPNKGYLPNWGVWGPLPADETPNWIAGLHIIQPCQLMTYDYQNNHMRDIGILTNNVGINWYRLFNLRKVNVPRVGLTLFGQLPLPHIVGGSKQSSGMAEWKAKVKAGRSALN